MANHLIDKNNYTKYKLSERETKNWNTLNHYAVF